jgi:hypothetical protein
MILLIPIPSLLTEIVKVLSGKLPTRGLGLRHRDHKESQTINQPKPQENLMGYLHISSHGIPPVGYFSLKVIKGY